MAIILRVDRFWTTLLFVFLLPIGPLGTLAKAQNRDLEYFEPESFFEWVNGSPNNDLAAIDTMPNIAETVKRLVPLADKGDVQAQLYLAFLELVETRQIKPRTVKWIARSVVASKKPVALYSAELIAEVIANEKGKSRLKKLKDWSLLVECLKSTEEPTPCNDKAKYLVSRDLM